MMAHIREYLDYMRPYWPTVALAATWLGILLVFMQKRRHWGKKQFLGRVNLSVNYVLDGRLAMRTLGERDASAIWPNEYGVSLVTRAAHKTTLDQPFIRLRDQKDVAFINRAVLNAVSEQFAPAYLAQALGVPVRTATFLFALTYERYENIRTLKLRVLLIEEEPLRRLFGPAQEVNRLDVKDAVYANRLQTLRLMHELYVKDPQALGRIEAAVIAVPERAEVGATTRPEPAEVA
jgi:hypothetical protein